MPTEEGGEKVEQIIEAVNRRYGSEEGHFRPLVSEKQGFNKYHAISKSVPLCRAFEPP